ncbi:MAG TPA: hypothetical protein VJ277_12985 [Gemmatimonadales bacterium]|jgi:hypothetical protein|nr:hypothetical protein [Gemmatimonadales bacterium]
MTKWPRRFAALALGAVLAVMVACSAADDSAGPTPPSELQVGGALLSLGDLHLLACSAQPYAVRTQTVGTAGGTIVIGTHRLVIPAGALAKPVQIKAEQLTGKVNSVRFSPEGLKFAKPATLSLSYSNCSPLLLLKRVVYTNELLGILELLPSIDDLRSRTVSAPIRHFSRYAVAW